MDVYWQMPLDELPNLVKVETDPAFGGIHQYRRPDQSLMFGKAKLNGWVYGFWHQHLYSIMLWVDGRSAYEDLRQEIFSRYGRGNRSKTNPDRFVWTSNQSQCMLDFDIDLMTGIFFMRSSELDHRIKQRYPLK